MMHRLSIKSKRRAHLHPKDWDRRGRVLAAMVERRLSVGDVARAVGRSPAYVSAVIWGVDRYRPTEESIAAVLGYAHAVLFLDGERL